MIAEKHNVHIINVQDLVLKSIEAAKSDETVKIETTVPKKKPEKPTPSPVSESSGVSEIDPEREHTFTPIFLGQITILCQIFLRQIFLRQNYTPIFCTPKFCTTGQIIFYAKFFYDKNSLQSRNGSSNRID